MPRVRSAAIYARYSTDRQADRSIEDQVTLCRDYATRNNLTVTEVYEDRAMSSASLFGRDGIMNLMADARSGKFDVVVVEAFDRLSRDQEDLSGIHKRLRFSEIEIFAVHDGQADVMKIGLQGLMGQMFLQQLKEKTHRGLAGRVKSGQSAGGLSYGYATVPGQPGALVIKDDEAAIVRRIFDEYAGGATPRDIAAGLNLDGVAPARGSVWSASSINGHKERGYGIFHNTLYIGERVWNRVQMLRDPDTGKRVNRTRPAAEWIREPVPELRIVSDAQWQAVRAELEKRSNGPRGRAGARRPKRPLSGLIKCGCCGGGMSIRKHRGSAVYIQCSRSHDSQTCDHKAQLRLDHIEQEIFEQLTTELRNPAYVRTYLEAYRKEREALLRAARTDRTRFERAAKKARAEFDRVTDLYIKGVIELTAETEAKMRRLKKEAEAAEFRLQAEAPDLPVIELHPATAKKHIEALAQIASQGTSECEATLKAVMTIRGLIKSVIVTPTDEGTDVTVYGSLGEILGLEEGRGGMLVAWGGFEQCPLSTIVFKKRAQ